MVSSIVEAAGAVEGHPVGPEIGDGIIGWSENEYGMWGYGTDGGVNGTSMTGIGVRGRSDGGTGVQAESAAGTALNVIGKATFSRSGKATIGAGKSSLTVTLAGVTTSSLVFAVLHSNRSGCYVRAIVPASGDFTIYLNKSTRSSTDVAYFVVN